MARTVLAALSVALLPYAAGLFLRSPAAAEGVLPWEQARKKALATLEQLTALEKGSLLKGSNSYLPGWYVGNTQPLPRLNLPALKMQDAGNGFRMVVPGFQHTVTMWPSSLALASTWDQGLVRSVAAGMGREFRAKGSNVMLGPAVNVHRVANNGRNFEYLSGEDPYLGARLVDAFVRGVQGEGVMACVKHFAFNEQETNRGSGPKASNSIVDARTAWELYYPPFQAAVEAGVGAVMCSYNRVNGTYSCENPELLSRDLKGAMGFQGFVMSDWGATHNTGAVALGLDQDMPGGSEPFFSAGELLGSHSAEADKAVLRVLSAMYHLRLEEQAGCQPPNCLSALLADVRSPEHARLAQEAATKAVTLLKNDGLLPLRVQRLAVLGAAAVAAPAADLMGVQGDYYAGGGSGHVAAKAVTTPLDGIKHRAAAANVSVRFSRKFDQELLRWADAAVVVGATTATEGIDRASLELDGGAGSLIERVAGLKPTVVIMETPGAVLTPWREHVGAIVNLFLGGQATGHALAAVLFGDVNPEGKLPLMMPASAADVISPQEEIVNYSEGLFTSYRSTRLKAAFPFGHGLSFTSFDYGPAEAYDCESAACVRLVITNSGSRAGVEVAQAYLHFAPEAGEPELVLRGFRKTRLLQPGESEALSFAFTGRDLSIYSSSVAAGWVLQSGVEVRIGASSADIRSTVQL